MTTFSWIERLTVSERLAAADQKVQGMLDLGVELVHLHECNRLVAYDSRLKAQIPRSYAGVAYRVFSRALVQRELAGVCTLWDSVRENRNSIPTVVALLRSPEMGDTIRVRKIEVATKGRSLSAENDDPALMAWITKLSDDHIEASASRRAALLDEVVDEVEAAATSPLVQAARDFRDAHLSHNLSAEAKKYPDLNARFGDEGRLLDLSLPILEKLNLVARNSSYDWSGSLRIAKRNAEALWLGCHFDVLE